MQAAILSKEELAALLHQCAEEATANALKKFKADEAAEMLLSPEAACKVFQPAVTRRTLATWADKGYIKKYTIGRAVFFRRGELIEAAKHVKKWKTLEV